MLLVKSGGHGVQRRAPDAMGGLGAGGRGGVGRGGMFRAMGVRQGVSKGRMDAQAEGGLGMTHQQHHL